jgi:hypothetical protein
MRVEVGIAERSVGTNSAQKAMAPTVRVNDTVASAGGGKEEASAGKVIGFKRKTCFLVGLHQPPSHHDKQAIPHRPAQLIPLLRRRTATTGWPALSMGPRGKMPEQRVMQCSPKSRADAPRQPTEMHAGHGAAFLHGNVVRHPTHHVQIGSARDFGNDLPLRWTDLTLIAEVRTLRTLRVP